MNLNTTPSSDQEPRRGAVREVSLLALKLGLIGFGGPAAHIAMLRNEVVTRRKWLTEQEFLDLLGATNLIPGPNSTEMVIHVGYRRAGWGGLIAAGSLFILPAAIMVGVLAWTYVHYGSTPAGQWLLYGIKPVIVAIILEAIWGLSRSAVKRPLLAVVGLGVLILYSLRINEIVLLFGSGIVVLLLEHARRLSRSRGGTAASSLVLMSVPLPWLAQTTAAAAAGVSLTTLFLTFLKIGSVLYGSGYVLVAFLRSDFVERLQWLTDQQLLDAIAIGQFTPGPVLTTATFVGYVLGDWPGAVLATVGIFLPSFVFVAAVNPIVPRLRASRSVGSVLDGVNVGALGLMAAATWEIGRAAIIDPLTGLLAIVAAVLLIRFKLSSVWLVLGGGVVGAAARLVGA